jgi:hypothetical protein
MKKNHIINRNNNLLIKTILHITVKITIIGNHTNISDSLIIIPVGVHIGHGITDVYILHIGIHGTGVLPFMLVIPIILITGDIGIPIQDMVIGDMVAITTIRTSL